MEKILIVVLVALAAMKFRKTNLGKWFEKQYEECTMNVVDRIDDKQSSSDMDKVISLCETHTTDEINENISRDYEHYQK